MVAFTTSAALAATLGWRQRVVRADWGRETSINVISNFANTPPYMCFTIHEILTAGNRVVVRGQASATPSVARFGVRHSGKSFRTMAIDIQVARDRKISEAFHMENWLSALNQLRSP
jgi:predicted ester cyclase